MRELLDCPLILTWYQRQRHNAADMHIRAIYVHIELELLANSLDVFQPFLIIWTCAANPDLCLVLDQSR